MQMMDLLFVFLQNKLVYRKEHIELTHSFTTMERVLLVSYSASFLILLINYFLLN